MLKKVVTLYKNAYAGLPRNAWLLALADFINRSGFMVLVFLNIYLTRRLNLSLLQAGHILSGYGIGAITGGYLGGYLSDRIGARKVMIWSLALSGVLLIATSRAREYGVVFGLIFLYGLIATALYPANDTAMSRFCPNGIRAKGFALRRLASNLGITIGPVVGGYLILLDYKWLFWIDGFTSLAAAAVIALWLKPRVAASTAPKPENPPAARSPWADGIYLRFLGLFLILVTVFAQIFSTFPLYLYSNYGLKENQIGPLWAVNTLLIVTVEMVLLHALRKRSWMNIIALGALLMGTGFALLPFGRSYLYAALTVSIWTFGEILTMPLTSTVIVARAGASAGRYLGLLSLTHSLSMFIAPLLGNWLLGSAGGTALWLIAGGAAAFSGFGFWLLRRKMVLTSGI